MNDCIYVGLDVHVQTVSMATAGWDEEPVFVGTFPNKPAKILEHLAALGDPAALRVCYEAGPTGYGLARMLLAHHIACTVVAPSLIPITPGRQVKTDRIDALKLARLLRSGDLTAVVIPTPELEAVRAVSRAREAIRRDTHRAMMRLVTFLRQRAIGEPTGTRWTKKWWRWLDELALPYQADQIVLTQLAAQIRFLGNQNASLVTALETTAGASASFGAGIDALQRMHGVGLITATGIVAELGDLTRFATAPQLFAYAGLVPREHSSGGRQKQGAITKTGNKHVRYLLVEAAWRIVRPVKPDTLTADDPIGQIAATARRRLHKRFWRLIAKGKNRNQAIVAIARELLGFLWSMACTVAAAPAAPAALAA